jgi:hypothetical protein
MPAVLSLALPLPTLRSRVVAIDAAAMIVWSGVETDVQNPEARSFIPHAVSTPRGAKLEFQVA